MKANTKVFIVRGASIDAIKPRLIKAKTVKQVQEHLLADFTIAPASAEEAHQLSDTRIEESKG